MVEPDRGLKILKLKEDYMKQATYNDRLIDADEGVDIKDSIGGRPEFRCPECGSPARVHRSGGRNPAHFEHLERNEDCSLVHRPR